MLRHVGAPQMIKHTRVPAVIAYKPYFFSQTVTIHIGNKVQMTIDSAIAVISGKAFFNLKSGKTFSIFLHSSSLFVLFLPLN
jgi:hypothetical protein